MGGTRCVFRNCKVSSQRNPKMHFFKFPVRHPKRLEAWLKNCSNEEITELADLKKLANRAVCARHFRVECFMNYKMDRLIASQMPKPTLMRINKYLAWDIENLDENGEPKMIKLKKPTAKHLIPPPKFECPLGFDNDDDVDVVEEEEEEQEIPGSSDADTIQKFDVRATKRKEHDEEEEEEVMPLVEEKKEQLKQGVKRLTMLDFRLVNEGHSLENIENEINIDVESVESSMQKAYDELQRKYQKLLLDHDQLKKSKASEMLPKISSSSSLKTLTKTELYQGLRKYLGPTMAALVRMEMFGGIDDRDWQDDERQFAMELLQLGDEVYTYCSEEWRFRLPSLRLVRYWLNHQNDNDQL